MSEKLAPHEYFDSTGNLLIKGERQGTRDINKVDIPFYDPYVECNDRGDPPPKRDTVQISVRRNLSRSSKDKSNFRLWMYH